jgi:hypothetical protein
MRFRGGSLGHINKTSILFSCITSRQWTFCDLFGVASPAVDVEIAEIGVGSHVSEGSVVSSARRHTSWSSRDIRPKLPNSAWSPSLSTRSAKTRRSGLVGIEKEPQMRMGQTSERSKPSGPEGMNCMVSAKRAIRLTVLCWYRLNSGTSEQR